MVQFMKELDDKIPSYVPNIYKLGPFGGLGGQKFTLVPSQVSLYQLVR